MGTSGEEGGDGNETGWAHALAGDDAEGFTVDRVASSEDLVQHARQCDLLVTLPVQGGCKGGGGESGERASRKGLERMWG